MKSQSTSILLVLFFASLVGLWWADFARIPTRQKIEQMSGRILPELIDLKPDDLRKIEILGGPEPLVFERQDQEKGNGWQMTSPMNVEADPSKVETLAYNLKELSRKPESAKLEVESSQFGLAPPERVIRLWGTKTSEPIASLDVGLESEALGRRYVRATGSEGVEVVDSKALALLKLLPIRWRDHELFRVPSFEVDAVRLKNSADQELKLRRGRDFWRVEAPIKALAAEAQVEGLIADLGSLRVSGDSQFIANDVRYPDLEKYGLRKPLLTIEVDAGRSSRRRPPQILHVGKPVAGNDGQIYVRREGQDDVLAVDARVLKDLKIDPNAYRSSKVADLKLNRVNRIGVEQPSGGFELVRNGADWTIVRPSAFRTDRKAVEEFLKGLDKLETTIYRSPSSVPDSGLNASSMVLKVWEATDPREASGTTEPNDEPALSLRIGRRDAARKVIYAQIEGDPTILALPDSANDFLPRSELAFRDHQVLSEEIEPIQRITLTGANRKFVLNSPPLKIDHLRMAPMGWWMVEPVDEPADAPSVGALLSLLSGLRAESLVTESAPDLDQFGLKTPALSLTWSRLPRFSMVDETPAPPYPSGVIPLLDRSLLVGSIVPGRSNQRFAKLSDRPLIFTIGASTIAVLDSEWRDHHVISFKPNHLKRLRFDWPTRSFAVEFSGQTDKQTWAFQGTVDAPNFDLTEVEKLVKAASNLSTARYVHHLGDFPAFAGLKAPRLSLRFELNDGTIPRTLRIGSSDGRGSVFATTEKAGSGAVFLLPEALVKPWLKAPRASDDLPDDVFAP
jgi:hypothetical protein